ncbi:hypothetical protein L596_025185 [Steinernema carpocapsae]|uniref:Uncharacterized protein n=1 Tax=Steinernema carpocapsae TaxID=34508 RepID=A0A4V5ZYQ7_STECR|nr:hypothetical protein L596_025185 [Steinernema carpocapsae]
MGEIAAAANYLPKGSQSDCRVRAAFQSSSPLPLLESHSELSLQPACLPRSATSFALFIDIKRQGSN